MKKLLFLLLFLPVILVGQTTITICDGDSALIYGNWQNSAGTYTNSNGNTDFHKVAVDLEGIDRLELKRAIATSQAKSTFTITLDKGLNMISLPKILLSNHK